MRSTPCAAIWKVHTDFQPQINAAFSRNQPLRKSTEGLNSGNWETLTTLQMEVWQMSTSSGMTKQWWSLAGLSCSLKCVGGIAPAVRGQGPGLIHHCKPLLWHQPAPSQFFSTMIISPLRLALCSPDSGSYALASSAPSIAYLFALVPEQWSSWVLTYIAQLGLGDSAVPN